MTANSVYTDIRWLGPGESEERDISWFAFSMAQDLSADGHAVLFTRYDEGAGLDYQIGLRRIDAAGAVLLGIGQATLLSPDGKWAIGITYSTPGLFALPTGTGERRTLTTPGFRYSTGGWFPDGTRILFIAEQEREPAAAYVQDLEGGAPRKVPSRIPQLDPNFGTSVSPDGQWFFGWQVSGPPVIVPIEGGEPRALPHLTENDFPRRWTADGRGLIVARRAPDLTKATHRPLRARHRPARSPADDHARRYERFATVRPHGLARRPNGGVQPGSVSHRPLPRRRTEIVGTCWPSITQRPGCWSVMPGWRRSRRPSRIASPSAGWGVFGGSRH